MTEVHHVTVDDDVVLALDAQQALVAGVRERSAYHELVDGHDLGAHELPLDVAVDATGNSVHQTGPAEWRRKIGKVPVVTAG